MPQEIILYGGSFDPPGKHHLEILKLIIRCFPNSRIVIIPCGPRKDKDNQSTNLYLRLEMVYYAFGALVDSLIEIDFDDLINQNFRPTHVLDEIYSKQGRVRHFVGADIIAGGAKGESYIHKHWARGAADYNQLRFLIGGRLGANFNEKDLSFDSLYLPINGIYGSSTEIRRRIKAGDKSFREMVCEEVADIIVRNGLYGWKK